ncbi:MAG: hydrogenase expression/formation protein HypE [Spirochaetes bacterium]|nr:MAG: hydrogenase expression/formation protein HypE [Spirochaetota bacterium]
MKDFGKITLAHGAGGDMSGELIRSVFMQAFGDENVQGSSDSAILEPGRGKMAFTTDSYVVQPLFFPGGDIGKLAVAGTINDLSVSGAIPLYLSFSVIIEEGFSISDLSKIAESAGETARSAGVQIVTGDTKVVEKGSCDGLFINTSGVGFIEEGLAGISTASRVKPGDSILVNGTIGDHETALLCSRKDIPVSSQIISDCAPLNSLIRELIGSCPSIAFMRDATRGGIATVLCELNELCGRGIEIKEDAIPMKEEVSGISGIFGYDPLFMANEGKVIFVVPKEDTETALGLLRKHPMGKEAAVIGRITQDNPDRTILKTRAGGSHILHRLSGMQLPRIC